MIENGAKKPSLETIWRIAYALNIRPSELVALVEVEMQNQEIEIETE
jgi:transcriptional regulator with XRE-family HTH domain